MLEFIKSKKILLAIFVFLLITVIAGYFLWSRKKAELETQMPTANTAVTANEEESDLLEGNPYSCKPTPDGHQFYRTDETLVVDPVNPDILYVSIEHIGFLKSVDGGKTWNLKTKGIKAYGRVDNPKKPCHSEYPTATIDPKDPNHVILGLSGTPTTFKEGYTKAGGIVQSFDGGESWKQMLADWMNLYVLDIAIDPKDPKKIFYSTTTSPSSFTGADKNKMFVKRGVIYRTFNGGKNWEELNTGILPNMSATKIFFDPADSNKLISFTYTYAPFEQGQGRNTGGVEQIGLLRSDDGGNTWAKSLPFASGFNSTLEAEQSPVNGNNLYVAPMAPRDVNSQAYYSSDFGASWKQAGKFIKIAAYDPHDPTGQRIVGFSYDELRPTNKITYLYESLDNGKTWKHTGSLPAEVINDDFSNQKAAISKIVFHPKEKNTIFMSGASGYVWKTSDNASTWETILDYKRVLDK